ncbi:hypothetical protein [Streptomyces sp. A30]|uniref:hypothetical protein n=1 Tax=Streptomyces sp. A30 TaxID=2789273 RepID=UPI0039804AA8
MALIVEEIGLLAADKRREEPTTIVRPSRSDSSRPGSTPWSPQPVPESPAPRMTGHRQMLMAAMQRGMVRSG